VGKPQDIVRSLDGLIAGNPNQKFGVKVKGNRGIGPEVVGCRLSEQLKSIARIVSRITAADSGACKRDEQQT
jgi:hypothetical protein